MGIRNVVIFDEDAKEGEDGSGPGDNSDSYCFTI